MTATTNVGIHLDEKRPFADRSLRKISTPTDRPRNGLPRHALPLQPEMFRQPVDLRRNASGPSPERPGGFSKLFMIALEPDEPPRSEFGPPPNIAECEDLGLVPPAT